jgi:ligand-binding sensor domain-containing protein/signal transduction histidine kinase
MRRMPTHPRARRCALFAPLLAAALASPSAAQTYPFRRYDVPEGLPNSRVNCVFQDSRGYLWFGTWEGLSRFDGVEFKNYGTKEGLPSFLVNAVAEDRKGRIWVATQGGGIARLIDEPAARRPREPDAPRTMFEPHKVGPTRESNVVVGLLVDSRGDLWCGCETGIYRATPGEGPDLAFERVTEGPISDSNQFACEDGRGGLWAGTQEGIVAVEGSRVVARYAPPEPQAGLRPLYALIPNPRGGALAVFARDVFEVEPSPEPGAAPAWRRVPISFSPFQEARRAFFASDGTLWIGTTSGLVRWRDGVQKTLTTDNGLPDTSVRCFCEDRDRDLWMGTWSSGATRLAGEAFTSYVLPEAMSDRNALNVFQAQDGSIYVSGKTGIARLQGNELALVPGSLDPEFAAVGARMLQDRRGDFWIGSAHGVFTCPGPDLDLRRRRRLTEAECPPQADVFGMFLEDPAGRISFGSLDGFVYLWDPARSPAPRFERIELQGFSPPRALHRDAAGQLWLAPYVGLARLAGDQVVPVEPSEGLPDLQTRCFFEDRRGRLWIGTRFQGVSVTDEPAAARPRFRGYSTRTGLASDAVWAIAEDEAGRMYFGTSRGIERLEVDTGRVAHLTSFDGLAGDIVNALIEDRDGNIWAATSGGLSRFDPRAETRPASPPPVFISRITVAGDELPISETGEKVAPTTTLAASRDNVRIEFVGLSFRDERDLAYQYELEGADPDWSAPSPQRSVQYAHLAPGGYRFLVRAVQASGVVSVEPASFAFRILRPAWQSPWFLAAALAAAGAIAYGLHRSRVRRILALEGIRTQIATDIHDDMGSGLTQIAILTEVAKRDSPPAAQGHLDEVGRLARAMRDSMSDIVWAVDPRRDRFADLVHRMRQAAFNLLGAEGLQVEFRAPEDGAIEDVGLAPDRRRHLLLVLKESLSNVARHARASRVEVEIRLASGKLFLSIVDDGRGFDPGAASAGHGLSSLRGRAAKLSGTIRIQSAPGSGTRIELDVPLGGRPA